MTRIAIGGWPVMQNNQAYFMKRAAEERSAAMRSTGKARAAHEEMASRYRQLAGNDESGVSQGDQLPAA